MIAKFWDLVSCLARSCSILCCEIHQRYTMTGPTLSRGRGHHRQTSHLPAAAMLQVLTGAHTPDTRRLARRVFIPRVLLYATPVYHKLSISARALLWWSHHDERLTLHAHHTHEEQRLRRASVQQALWPGQWPSAVYPDDHSPAHHTPKTSHRGLQLRVNQLTSSREGRQN